MVRLRSAGWLIASQATGTGVGVVSSILLARALGPSGKGTVTVTQALTGMAGVILAAGLPGAAGYLAAKGRVDGRTETRVAWSTSLLVTGVTLLVAIPLAPWIAQSLFQSDSSALVWLSLLAVAPYLANQVFTGFLLGVGRARKTAIINASQLVANLGGIVILELSGHLTPENFIVWWLAVLLVAALVQTAILLRMPANPQSPTVFGTIRMGARFGAASWASSGLYLLALRVDTLLLTALSGTADVGIYSVGVSLAEIGWYLPNALYAVLFPKVAAQGQEARELVGRVARMSWPLVLVTGVCLVGLARVLVVPFYGSAFSGAVGVVAVLVPGMTAAALSSVLSSYVAGRGKPGLATVAATVNLAVNVALNVLLIPPLGYLGAAAASSVSYSLAAAVMILFFLRETGLPAKSVLVPRRSDFSEISIRRRGQLSRTG